MSKWVFDIEADGLLQVCTQVWVIVAKNIETGEIRSWKPFQGDMSWKEVFNNASMLIGHNILGFDLPALQKIFGYVLPRNVMIRDTLPLSQVLNYRRFGDDGHSLAVWGNHLNFVKLEFANWHEYSDEMLEYCTNDVLLSHKVYQVLEAELHQETKKHRYLPWHLKGEQAVMKWSALAELHGWPFDREAAMELYDRLEQEMQKAYDALSSQLGTKVVAVDKKKGVVEVKKPKFTKVGFYDQHTANWFGIEPVSGHDEEDRLVVGEYCRIRIEPLSLDSTDDVKVFLYRNGWQPTQWNYKKQEDGSKAKTSPKITEDSLEFLGGDGKLYVDFLTAKSRHGILKTWLENLKEGDTLHGECVTIGTPSFRARHKIIVNVPSTDSLWGPEMRKLFKCKPGWKLIGCDSAGNQARGLAHYLGNQEFIDILLNGDIHQYNANILTSVLESMGIERVVQRSQAKRILYAFLFGASGGKLWLYIFGTIDNEQGAKLKNGFLKAVPGFAELLDKLRKIYSKTKQYGDGYIYGLSGCKLYVDSYHKLLVYLLQCAEKVTCSAATMLTMERLEAEDIPYIPCIFYHDENDFMVPEEYAVRAAQIGKEAFKDGPKLFGITIMDGDARIGDNWYDVH
jgi:DNA polymerase-1